jgi:hypothetical protein
MPRAEINCPVGTSVTVLGDISFHLPNRQSRRKQQPTSIATNNIKQQLKSVVICGRNHFIIKTFNTFGVVGLLLHYFHRFHRRLFILKSFGLPLLLTGYCSLLTDHCSLFPTLKLFDIRLCDSPSFWPTNPIKWQITPSLTLINKFCITKQALTRWNMSYILNIQSSCN